MNGRSQDSGDLSAFCMKTSTPRLPVGLTPTSHLPQQPGLVSVGLTPTSHLPQVPRFSQWDLLLLHTCLTCLDWPHWDSLNFFTPPLAAWVGLSGTHSHFFRPFSAAWVGLSGTPSQFTPPLAAWVDLAGQCLHSSLPYMTEEDSHLLSSAWP